MSDTLKKKRSKQSFSEAWLNDDRFKSWIRKVSCDDSLVHCVVCNNNFSCSLSHIMRHADSINHKNNIIKNTPSSSSSTPLSLYNENVNSRKRKSPKDIFRQQWLDIDLFKPWLREVSHDKHSFFCSFCNTSCIGGLSQIYRHANGKIHKIMRERNEIDTNQSNEDLNDNESFLSFDERKKEAEIRFAALIADKNIPHRTANEILTLFQEIGKDYNVLKNMSMSARKCSKIISNVLGEVETDRVVKNIKNTKFSIFIDETSDITNTKWMTFIVRYVHPETLNIRSQLVKLIDIDARDSSAEKLFTAFKIEMCKLNIPFKNIIAMSCDNASVMTGKHLSFKKRLQENCKNVLTLTCPCHSAALSAQAACAKIPDYVEEFLKKIANFINSSPKRSAIYREFCDSFQEKNLQILKLSNTRWLSYHSCVERLVDSWNTVQLFINEIVLSDKTKTGTYLLSIMEKVDVKAYLLFLKHVLNFFNSFNAFFQAAETRIHLLQPKSEEFLNVICKHFLQPQHLNNVGNNFDFDEKENQKTLEEVDLGFQCKNYLDELMKEGYADVVANIRKNCLQFYVTAAKEIIKRFPLNDKFLTKLKVFQFPMSIVDTDRETSFNDVSFIAETLGDFDIDGLKKEWFTLHLDLTQTEKEELLELNFDDMWKHIFQSQHSTNIDKYFNLKCLLNAIRSLPNSNADAERLFSILTDVKTKKRNKFSSHSINGICVFKSALKARKETVLDMNIDAEHFSRMSTNTLYKSNCKKPKSSLTLYPADDDIATFSSSDDDIM